MYWYFLFCIVLCLCQGSLHLNARLFFRVGCSRQPLALEGFLSGSVLIVGRALEVFRPMSLGLRFVGWFPVGFSWLVACQHHRWSRYESVPCMILCVYSGPRPQPKVRAPSSGVHLPTVDGTTADAPPCTDGSGWGGAVKKLQTPDPTTQLSRTRSRLRETKHQCLFRILPSTFLSEAMAERRAAIATGR